MTVGATTPSMRITPSNAAAMGRPKFSVQRVPSRVGTNNAGSSGFLYSCEKRQCSGTNGRGTGRPTLYFEVRVDGKPSDPLQWLRPQRLNTK